jgi:hypothetical protein
MSRQLADLFANNPQLAFDFYRAASEIVDDFEEFGSVLQANDAGDYDETTAIGKLQALRNEIIALSRASNSR